MTLEFEKLTNDLDALVLSAYQRRQQNDDQIEAALQKLHHHATLWDTIDACVEQAIRDTDQKFYRSARPLDRVEPLNASVPAPPGPAEATIVAVDGSQILPDRHAAFLYYLINVGVFVYDHGRGRHPEAFTRPTLVYPREELVEGEDPAGGDDFAAGSSAVGVQRDLAEIGTLADMAWRYRAEGRLLMAVLDQRLLYWPVGTVRASESRDVIGDWLAAMTRVRDSGGLLVGYIDRPGKSSVMTMLDSLDINQRDFDLNDLTRRDRWLGPTDVDLFARLLGSGERSKVMLDISEHNRRFADEDRGNEVCFFYLNAAGKGAGDSGMQIARVDIPMWLAQDPSLVEAVHGLLVDQCQVLGDYPYALTRADEIAVVGRADQAELEHRISLRMQAAGLEGAITAKQLSKQFARSGKTRHGI